jgi:hypothetical protein
MNDQISEKEFTRFSFNFYESFLILIRFTFVNKITITLTSLYLIYSIYSIFVDAGRSKKLLELIQNPDIGYKVFMFLYAFFAILWIILYPLLPIFIFMLLVSGYGLIQFLINVKKCSFAFKDSRIVIKNQIAESTVSLKESKFIPFGNLFIVKFLNSDDFLIIPIRLLSATDIEVVKSRMQK